MTNRMIYYPLSVLLLGGIRESDHHYASWTQTSSSAALGDGGPAGAYFA